MNPVSMIINFGDRHHYSGEHDREGSAHKHDSGEHDHDCGDL